MGSSPIKWKLSDLGLELPLRDGLSLCSGRDPIREAQQWLARQSRTALQGHVGVIGLGAGFHIQGLLENHNISQVTVFEIDLELAQEWQDCERLNLVMQDQWKQYRYLDLHSILTFRPAWQGQLETFTNLQKFILGDQNIVEVISSPNSQLMKDITYWNLAREFVK